MRSAHLSDRVAPAPRAGDRILGDLGRRPPRHIHGRHVPWKPGPAQGRWQCRASAQGLRVPRDGHRHRRVAAALRDAVRERRLRRHRRRNHGSCGRRGALSAAADHDDGGDAPRRGPMGRSHARRRVVARILLWRQHRRRGGRYAAGGLLSAPRLRYGGRDVGRAGAERWGCDRRADSRLANAVSAGRQ